MPTLPRSILALMRDRVNVSYRSGNLDDGKGNPVLTAETNVIARVKRGTTTVRDERGEEVTARVRVALSKDFPTLDSGGKVTMADGTELGPIISVDRSPGPQGWGHVVTVNIG